MLNIHIITGPNIYFEKLHKYDGVIYRSITANIDIPNAPKKLKAFIQKVPKILAWKQSVIDYAVGLN